MKRRIFNIKGKRLVEGDANLTNQDEILVKELQDNRVALLENIDGKLVNIGGLEEEKEKRPEIVDTVVLARHHLPRMQYIEEINLTFGKGNILQYKKDNSNNIAGDYTVIIRDKHGTAIRTLSGSGSYLEKIASSYGANMENKCLILTPYISNDTLNIAIEVAKDGYYELENVLDSNRERQLIQIRNGYCVTPFGGGTKPMRFKYPLSDDTLRIRGTRKDNVSLPSDTRGTATKYLHVLLKKNPLFTFDEVAWLSKLSDEELKNHLISVKVSKTMMH
jgi:hypothetical protein